MCSGFCVRGGITIPCFFNVGIPNCAMGDAVAEYEWGGALDGEDGHGLDGERNTAGAGCYGIYGGADGFQFFANDGEEERFIRGFV